jgi:hypothetical protein
MPDFFVIAVSLREKRATDLRLASESLLISCSTRRQRSGVITYVKNTPPIILQAPALSLARESGYAQPRLNRENLAFMTIRLL